MTPDRMTHFHGADRDTGASTVFEVINPEYVKWLEERLKWAVSVLDSLGHDLQTGQETKTVIALRAHARAEELRKELK